MTLLSVIPANDGIKKYIAVFSNGKRVKFGQYGSKTYLEGADKLTRANYQKRHIRDLDTKDPYRPGFLSFYILWSDARDLQTAIQNYNRKFF